MKLYMKQKVFSWADRFCIKDELEADRYYIEGEIFALGKRLHVRDVNGRELAFIRQKLIALMPRYYIEIGERSIELVKELTLLKPRFHFEELPWTLQGDFMAHEYTLCDGGRVLMRLSKKWWTWGDTYELDITDPENELLGLCTALAVDCVLEQQQTSPKLRARFAP